jgi:TRAP-type C4-dicarboxylate transport system permease small subunit
VLGLSRALDRLDLAAKWLIIAAMAVMIVVVSVRSLRYCAQHLARLVRRGVAHALRVVHVPRDPARHPRGRARQPELLVGHLPRWRACSSRRWPLIAAGMMAIVLYETISVAYETWDELLPTLDMSTNWFLVPVAVAAAHSILHLVQLLWREPVRTVVTME